MKKLKYILILLLIFSDTISYSCNCFGKTKIKYEIKKSDIIIEATIVSKTIIFVNENDIPEHFWIKKNEFLVKIDKIYKGTIKSEFIKIQTGLGHGDCGYNFLIGQKYIIYGTYSLHKNIDNEYIIETDICTRTMLFNKKEVKKINRYLTSNRSRLNPFAG